MPERFIFRLFAAILFSPVLTFSQTKTLDDRKPLPALQDRQSAATLININNWSMWVHANGVSANSPSGLEGGFYPRQTGHVIFADGIVWGGLG